MDLHSICLIRFYIKPARGNVRRGYSSGVEHSTADREVPGSIPGVPYFYGIYFENVLEIYGNTNVSLVKQLSIFVLSRNLKLKIQQLLIASGRAVR